MSFRDLERAILAELKVVSQNTKLRLNDIMEWRNSELQPHEDETLYFLPNLKIWCCVKIPKPLKVTIQTPGG